ncbi:MAG TPA: biotin/lipoate A/B protein ligase family protein [Anaerolineaceae bacterium]|jgi:lipoate-protein ligase A
MIFRMIPFRYFSAPMNMAIDEAILDGLRAGSSPPTIRFYGWDPSAVSIGRFQGLEYEVNLAACRQAGVDVVRRITGGGAVYHDRDGEVTYSILGPAGLFPERIPDSYRTICDDVVSALQILGIPAEFSPINDIMVEGRKISGNAQTRKAGLFLQHGTVLYQVDVEKMFALLSVSPEKISDKLIRSVKKRVTSVSEYRQIPLEALAEAMQTAFARSRSVEMGDYTPTELERARQLAEEKYATQAWNALR